MKKECSCISCSSGERCTKEIRINVEPMKKMNEKTIQQVNKEIEKEIEGHREQSRLNLITEIIDRIEDLEKCLMDAPVDYQDRKDVLEDFLIKLQKNIY